LKSWLVETSGDGKKWRVIAQKEDNMQLNGYRFTGAFSVVGGGGCRFIRLVNVGMNLPGNDCLCIQAWEVFGSILR
jgi:hypothetical protein